MKTVFEVSDRGEVKLRFVDEEGRVVREIPHVVTGGEAGRMLQRSRRHFYRYLKREVLRPVAKFSDELFFDLQEVQQLAGSPSSRQISLPSSMAPLFPEYDTRGLHLKRDADVILSRILERGSISEIRWATRHFSRARRRLFLKREGSRLLSRRAYRFWSWLLVVPEERSRNYWRQAGLRVGGVE